LAKIGEGTKWKLLVFELNSNIHSQQRALANAVAIGTAQRNGKLAVVCSANALQVDKQNDNDWNQGLLFFNSSQVWLQPPGYVTQMIGRGYLPHCVRAEVKSPADCLDVTATTGNNGKLLQLQVVNLKPTPVKTQITAAGFMPEKPMAIAETLAADLNVANTAESPNRIVPKTTQWEHQLPSGHAMFTFQGNSFTILRFE
jgi:alpha-L-arabinofuranosidase